MLSQSVFGQTKQPGEWPKRFRLLCVWCVLSSMFSPFIRLWRLRGIVGCSDLDLSVRREFLTERLGVSETSVKDDFTRGGATLATETARRGMVGPRKT